MTDKMLITTHEVASALEGGAMMCSLTSGGEALLRKAGTALDPDSLAERRALDDGLPIVQLSHEQIMLVAFGDTVLAEASDGQDGMIRVEVRVMTPQELLDAHAQACAKYGDEPRMSFADAIRLTQTLKTGDFR